MTARGLRFRVYALLAEVLQRLLSRVQARLIREHGTSAPVWLRGDPDAPPVPPEWAARATPRPPADWVEKVAAHAPHLLDNVDPAYVRSVLAAREPAAHPITESPRVGPVTLPVPPPIPTRRGDHRPPRNAGWPARHKAEFAVSEFESTRRDAPPISADDTRMPSRPPLEVTHTEIHEMPPRPSVTTATRSVPSPQTVSRSRGAYLPLIVHDSQPPARSAPRTVETPFDLPQPPTQVETHVPPVPTETVERVSMLLKPPATDTVQVVDAQAGKWASLPDTEIEPDEPRDRVERHRARLDHEQRGEPWIE